MLLLFLFRFGYIKIPSRSPPPSPSLLLSSLRLSPPALPPHVPSSLLFSCCVLFVRIMWGKLPDERKLSEYKATCVAVGEVKQRGHERHGLGQPEVGRQAEGLLRHRNTGRMSRPVFWKLHGGCRGLLARELLMLLASISFLRGPEASGTGWMTD